MGADSPSGLSRSSEETNRRRMLTLMGAGGAAALATLVTAKEAQAGHEDPPTNVMHLGSQNSAPGTTEIHADVAGPVLVLGNTEGEGHSSLQCNTPVNISVNRASDALFIDNANSDPNLAGGISATAHGGPHGVEGAAFPSAEVNQGIGVLGVSLSATGGFGEGPGVGVSGLSGTGAGVQGRSDSGPGGNFSSNSGIGLHVESNSGPGLKVIANIAGDEGHGLEVENTHPTGKGIFAKGADFGVAGFSDSSGGTGVEARGQFAGLSAFGEGVDSRAIVAFVKEADGTDIPNGTALEIHGRSKFSTVGNATVPAGQNSVFVADSGITGDSHISVTLMGNPGLRGVHWVERNPGSGFTVHLLSGPGPKPATPLTYLIVEPV